MASLSNETIVKLRESNELDSLAARLLDCAAVSFIEKAWGRGDNARSADGSYCLPTSPEAVQWCAQGALSAAAFKLGVLVRDETYTAAIVYANARRGSRITARARHALQVAAAGGNETEAPQISIKDWNDAPKQTAEKVAEAFRIGAGYLRERIEAVQDGIKGNPANWFAGTRQKGER